MLSEENYQKWSILGFAGVGMYSLIPIISTPLIILSVLDFKIAGYF
jgi:hypothetical protein